MTITNGRLNRIVGTRAFAAGLASCMILSLALAGGADARTTRYVAHAATLSPVASARHTPKKHKASSLITPRSITGSLIKKGSIPGSDLQLPIQGTDIGPGIDGDNIKAGSLPFSALSTSLKDIFAALIEKQIPTGPTGPSGAAGPVGPAGPSGPSTAPTTELTLNSDFQSVAQLNITSLGTYLISADIPVYANNSNEEISCQIGTPGSTPFYVEGEYPIPTQFVNEQYKGQSVFNLQTTEELLPGTVALSCSSNGEAPGIANVSFAATPTTEQ
jgi:hypothetical protein